MKEDKIRDKLKNANYIDELIECDKRHTIERKLNFMISGKPVNYVRERKGRGNHFYNKKGSIMEDYKLQMIKSMNKDDYEYTRELIKSNKTFYVKLKALYYIGIPKGDSIETSVKKEIGIIRPAITPDLDNYDKFIIDALHSVVYDDDKVLVDIESKKYYSLDPRTELEITIIEKIK